MTDSAFGLFQLDEDLQEAVVSTIRKWLPTYLALIERKVELAPRSIPLPRSYVLSDNGELNKKPEDQLPAVVVLCPGGGKITPRQEGDGRIRAGYVVNVACIVTARDHESTDKLARRYRKALELILVHQPSLGGFAEASIFRGWRNDELLPEDDRTIAAGTNVFEVLVPDISQAGKGLQAPLDDPYEEAEIPAVTEADVTLEPEAL